MANAASHGPLGNGRQWAELIPDGQWSLYQSVIDRARARQLPFALGGGFAFSLYTGAWRNTKDMDLYILPRDRDGMVQVLHDAGFADMMPDKPYDPAWIFRGIQGDIIVDVIFAMANQRDVVDEQWLTRGPVIRLRDEKLRAIPPEELVRAKLYVLQRDRCDWPDLINLLYARGRALDWEFLLQRLGPDVPLLAGLVQVFSWICPAQAAQLPAWVWPRLRLLPPDGEPSCSDDPQRVRFLDSRPWFAPLHEGALPQLHQ